MAKKNQSGSMIRLWNQQKWDVLEVAVSLSEKENRKVSEAEIASRAVLCGLPILKRKLGLI